MEKRIDLALLHTPPHLEALEIRPLLTERMFVIGPPKHRIKEKAHPKSFRIRDLGALPLILPNGAHANRPGSRPCGRVVEQEVIAIQRHVLGSDVDAAPGGSE